MRLDSKAPYSNSALAVSRALNQSDLSQSCLKKEALQRSSEVLQLNRVAAVAVPTVRRTYLRKIQSTSTEYVLRSREVRKCVMVASSCG
jgi:hypothetical protein